MITLLATLTVAAQAIVVLAVVAWVLARIGERRLLDLLRRVVGADAIRLAWLVAAVATAGSLYMSEARHFPPCPLCWYQRICMYPLVVLLGVAAVTRDRSIARYVLPLTAIGGAISAYHYQLERFPDQAPIACSSSVPCTTVWFESLGYITLPLMAFTAFALTSTILLLGERNRHGQGRTTEA